MSLSDPDFPKAIGAFLLSAFCGGLCYAAATVGARYISPMPKHVYFGRLVLLLILGGFTWYYFCNQGSTVIIDHHVAPRKFGTAYGAHTVFAWFALALISWPGAKNDEKTA